MDNTNQVPPTLLNDKQQAGSDTYSNSKIKNSNTKKGIGNAKDRVKEGLAAYSKMDKTKKRVFLSAAILVFSIFLLLLTSLVNGIKRSSPSLPKIDNTPKPTRLTDEGEFTPSHYADDEEVVELNQKIKILREEYEKTSLQESNLQPPPLDFEISFEED